MKSRMLKLFSASLALSLVGAVGASGMAFTPTQADLLSMVETSFGPNTSTTNSVTADAGGVLYDVNWDELGEGFSRLVYQKESFNTDLSAFDSFDVSIDAINPNGVGIKLFVQTGSGFAFSETAFISAAAGATELVSLDLTGLSDTNDVKQFGYQVFGPGGDIQGAQFRVRPVPEPATAALLALGTLAMTRRRKA